MHPRGHLIPAQSLVSGSRAPRRGQKPKTVQGLEEVVGKTWQRRPRVPTRSLRACPQPHTRLTASGSAAGPGFWFQSAQPGSADPKPRPAQSLSRVAPPPAPRAEGAAPGGGASGASEPSVRGGAERGLSLLSHRLPAPPPRRGGRDSRRPRAQAPIACCVCCLAR